MKRKNMARNALFTSIMSLLLCVSMLVGTTFAWFTDEVVTGMNTIAAGNLDVELLANGASVDSNTKLFDDVTLWEPGAVVYENLQVVNAGTLALKYQMSLNFGNENDLNGHKLSEVLKVVVLNETIDASTMTRAQVLEKAKAAAEADQGAGSLSNFYLTGELEAKTSGAAFAVVVFWAPNDDATDNLYNANNGKTTSDGEPLHIEFGVNLQATQKMSENDSFGNDYDKFSSILPKATVNNTGAQTVNVWQGYSDEGSLAMDTSFQFLPNETLEEAEASAYKYWHADYVIKADKDVPANSMALGGYYEAFCGENGWVTLTADETITAGTEIRLVDTLGVTVNYNEICQYGNDGVGFLCGVADLTGANAGTTITVELRLYETTVDPSNPSGNKNEETGKYEVIGKYSYTFVNTVSTAEELKTQLAAGHDVVLAADIALDKNDTITVTNDVAIDLNGHKLSASADKTGNQEAFLVKGNLTVKNGSMEMTALNNQGWNAMATVFDVTAGGVLNLDGVTAVTSGTDMAFVAHLNNWGDVTLNAENCTLKSNYVAVRINNSGPDMNNVTIKNSYLEGTSNALWVHNYTTEDFGGKLYSAASAAYDQALVNDRLTIDLTGSTLVGNPEKAGPIRLGMTNAIYGDVSILP